MVACAVLSAGDSRVAWLAERYGGHRSDTHPQPGPRGHRSVRYAFKGGCQPRRDVSVHSGLRVHLMEPDPRWTKAGQRP